MAEIEKMFESIGLKKQYCGWLDMGDLDCQPQYVRCNSITEWKDAVLSSRFGETEEEPEHKYPPFTAEKQLELIKWLAKRFNSDYVAYWYNEIKGTWIFRLYDLTELSSEEPCVEEGRNKNFADALCNLINHLWQSLADQEKEEIRNILK